MNSERQQQLGGLAAFGAQFKGKAGDIDAIADGIAFVGGMRLLQEIGDVLQDVIGRKWQILAQNSQFLFTFGKIDQDLRLQARMDVFGQIEGGGIFVHGGDEAKIAMGFDLNARQQ